MRRGAALGAVALGAVTIAVVLPALGAFSGGKGTASAANTKHMDMNMPGMDMDMPGMTTTGTRYWQGVSGSAFHSDGVTRTYYIAADKVVWDYAPRGRDEITGKPFDEVADTYVKNGPGRIGSKYIKCLYRGYTDASFQHLERRPADQQYLGLLGPVIRPEVGDTIKVVFRNNCPFAASMHPHGRDVREGQ
jgi:hypothetical protein